MFHFISETKSGKGTSETGKRRHHREVTGPTEWVSSTPKQKTKTSEIRLCVEMRDVNKEICRKWHVKPNNLGASLRSQWCYCLQQDWCSFWISLTRTWSWVEIQHNIFNLCRLVPLQKTYPIGLTYAAEVFQHTIQELDLESRFITTFSTHVGLYRYKDLSLVWTPPLKCSSTPFKNLISSRDSSQHSQLM